MVVDSFKSGFEPPGDFPFEDYSQHIYRTISDGTISASKQESGKVDAKTTVGKTKGKLWLFGKKPKVKAIKFLYANQIFLVSQLSQHRHEWIMIYS
jgi:hypothetical protein